MTFDHAVTLSAVVLGPAGIWFGWWLAERADDKRYLRSTREAEDQATTERVSRLLREGRRATGEFRALAHATHLGKAVTSGDQFRATMGEFNSAWRSVEIELAEVELLGPSSILDAAQTMFEAGQRGISTLIRMQRSRTAAVTRHLSRSRSANWTPR